MAIQQKKYIYKKEVKKNERIKKIKKKKKKTYLYRYINIAVRKKLYRRSLNKIKIFQVKILYKAQ